MYFISTNSKDFPWQQAERLYNENKKYFLPLDITFEELANWANGNLWATIEDDLFIGLIYFDFKDNKWFLNGCSERKMFKYISKAINELCTLYFEQTDVIYSETEHTHAKIALKRAGFIQIHPNIFRKEKE